MTKPDLSVRAASVQLIEDANAASINEDSIRQLVHGFYATIRDDDLLGPIFEREISADGWPVHLQKMCDFWSSVLLRTSRYDGRPLPPHLAIGEISEHHFQRWLALFRRAAAEAFEPGGAAEVTGLAERIAHSFRLAIAFHRGEDSTRIERLVAG